MRESLRSFFADLEAPDRNLVVLNRSSPDPVFGLLTSLLDGQPVSVSDVDMPDDPDSDVVALVEDGEVIARSTLDDLLESVLLINSDLYKTGAIDLDDVVLPTCFAGLMRFHSAFAGTPNRTKRSCC